MIGSWRFSACQMRNWRSGSASCWPLRSSPSGASGRVVRLEDDIRPAILALSVTSPQGHLRAELATHPRGVRPGDLVTALGTDAVPGRACRTHQWIERDGARFEPLPVSGPGTGASATQHARRAFPHVRDGNQPDPGGSPPGGPPAGEPAPRRRRALAQPSRPPRPARRARRRSRSRVPQAQDRRHPSRARVAPPPPKAAPAPVVPLARPEATAPMEAEIDVAGPAGPDRRRRGGTGAPHPQPAPLGPRRDRRSKQVGRYLVCVHVQPHMTQIAMLEGRTLVEHYVSRAADDTNQIDGNVYRGRVQNVLPGMEAAFVDIGIPKNAVLYRGDVRYDKDDIEGGASQQPRIEDVLKAGQVILCQVTKNPIGAKGARLTQEVSLPGRFAVLVPNSSAFGISKRLGRHRAPPPAPHHRRGQAGRARHDRAHGGRGCLRRRAPARRHDAARAVERH